MSDFQVQSRSSVSFADSTKTNVTPKATTTEVKNTSLQNVDSAVINKSGSEAFAASNKVPKVNVLEGSKQGAKTRAVQGAVIGGIGGGLGGALLVGAIGAMNNGVTAGSMITGVVVGGAIGAGAGAGIGAVTGAVEGAVFSKLSGGDPTKGAVAGAVILGGLGALSFKKGTTEGIIGVASGLAIGAYVGYKATVAATK